ncbi:ATP-binding protein [Ponticaulis sp.]|uniref:ATP-binding protein n=1 Tax=Ponticaulis sp. TaxID=2020902 RepID=UPI000B68970A|nr:ATP-binding protein [Ponticaulis sp.]MAJ09956.1 hypothetical protein [Ponticaulis sp.]RPG18565.1 MAG: response regulator [Hyphomonadaceae bacterium TMED125]
MSFKVIDNDELENVATVSVSLWSGPFDGLLNWLDRAFQLEQLEDQNDRPIAQNVLIMCGLQTTLGLFALMLEFFGRGEATTSQLVGCISVSILSVLPAFLIYTHRVRLSAWIFCISISFTAMTICLLNSGINSATTPILILPVLWGWTMLRLKGAVTLSALALAQTFFLVWWSVSGNAPYTSPNFGDLPPAVSTGFVMAYIIISAVVSGGVAWYNHRQHEKRLIKMRDEARFASRAKAEFIAGVAHEIRTPLTGLMGMLELLAKEELDSNQGEMAGTAKSSARNILNLINDLLDLSKIEVGELRLLPEPTDVTQLFRETAMELRPSAVDQGLEFRLSYPDEAVWLLIDPVRFRQILSNFLSNAIKFTDRGYVKAAMQVEDVDSGEVLVRLSVEDTGRGIHPNHQKRIFSRFVQIETDQRANYKGTGLGLAIVHDLARLQGGDVWVESIEGKGSTFNFEAEYKRTSALDIPTASRLSKHDRQYTILIADDSVGNQRVITRVLQGLGYRTISVANGSDAVLAIAERDIDLVLMDFRMPVKDGPTALQDIRNLPDQTRAQIPVIGLSADNSEHDMQKWVAAGVDGFIQKPVDFANMDITIRRILGLQRQSHEGEPSVAE